MAPSKSIGIEALILGIVVMIALPLVYALSGIVWNGARWGTAAYGLATLGVLVGLASVVVAVRAIVGASPAQQSALLGWGAIVCAVLGVGTAALGWIVGWVFAGG